VGNSLEFQERLKEQVDAISTPIYMTTKAEIVDYYKDTQGKGWKQAIVKDLSAITGMKTKNLERRFDPSRLQNVEKRNAAQYAALGKQLPPKGRRLPSNIRIKVKGQSDPSPKRKRGGKWVGESARVRSWEAGMSGMEAYNFMQEPTMEGFFEKLGNMDPDLFTETLADNASIEITGE
jgi:hypothetical protein